MEHTKTNFLFFDSGTPGLHRHANMTEDAAGIHQGPSGEQGCRSRHTKHQTNTGAPVRQGPHASSSAAPLSRPTRPTLHSRSIPVQAHSAHFNQFVAHTHHHTSPNCKRYIRITCHPTLSCTSGCKFRAAVSQPSKRPRPPANDIPLHQTKTQRIVH